MLLARQLTAFSLSGAGGCLRECDWVPSPSPGLPDLRWYDGADCIGLRFRHRSIQAGSTSCALCSSIFVSFDVKRCEAEVRNNECGLPCYGSKMESELLPEPKPECLKKQQERARRAHASVLDATPEIHPKTRSRANFEWTSPHTSAPLSKSTRARAHFLRFCFSAFSPLGPLGTWEDCVFSAWTQWSVCQSQVDQASVLCRTPENASTVHLPFRRYENGTSTEHRCTAASPETLQHLRDPLKGLLSKGSPF